ncbi:hypothetical protein PV377_44170, partial [Streptomyces ipomoeae]|uniref:hypothetical protein n=1 Tax=Streptomyces ipomoeae TaxID=103232 RepID=UPI0029BD2215
MHARAFVGPVRLLGPLVVGGLVLVVLDAVAGRRRRPPSARPPWAGPERGVPPEGRQGSPLARR